MQVVNGFAALLSSSLDLERALKVMGYRSWLGQALKRRNNVSLGLCLIDKDTEEFSAMHGELYGADTARISDSDIDTLPGLLAMIDGSYTFVLPSDDTLIFARDQLGTKPLYYAGSAGSFGVASDARVLKQLFDEVNSAEPGVLYKATPNSLTQISFNTLNYIQSMHHDEALKTVSMLLHESVKRRVANKKKVALGFSGGIDSIVLSILASKYTEIIAVTVCTKDSFDYKVCESIADRLGIYLKMIIVDERTIKDTIKKLHDIIQLPNAMHMSIASAVYMLAKFTKEIGAEALMLGQLADELFGGYARYVKYRRVSAEKVGNAMFNDVKNAYKDNFYRDEIASSPFTRLLLPYASLDLIKYVVNLPVDLKLNSRTGARKILLRELAKNIGIDDELANREKKALHFSSGIYKIVSKLC